MSDKGGNTERLVKICIEKCGIGKDNFIWLIGGLEASIQKSYKPTKDDELPQYRKYGRVTRGRINLLSNYCFNQDLLIPMRPEEINWLKMFSSDGWFFINTVRADGGDHELFFTLNIPILHSADCADRISIHCRVHTKHGSNIAYTLRGISSEFDYDDILRVLERYSII